MDNLSEKVQFNHGRTLAIVSLVLGVCACVISWIPFVGLLGIALGGVGLLLALLAFILVFAQKQPGAILSVLGGVACTLAIMVSCGASYISGILLNDSTNANIRRENELELDPPEKAIRVTASKFWTDYETNSNDADNRYLHKTLEITGVVQNINTTWGSNIRNINMIPRSGFTMNSIACYFGPKHDQELNNIAQGQLVTIRGRYRSRLGSFFVYNCTVVK